MNDMLSTIIDRAETANSQQQSDYISKSDGLLYCGSCHTPKQIKIEVLGSERLVPCLCSCREKRQQEEAEQKEMERLAERRQSCFADVKYLSATFDKDDRANEELSKACMKYAEKFNASADWLLLFGDCGTGKSFAAACICNELISKGLSVRFTTISQIEQELWGTTNKSEIYDKLSKYDLLCIDDLGAERSSEYMQQITFDVIDKRLCSGKPCVITSNLSGADFSNPKNLAEKRIYSRVFERSIPFHVRGADRRFKELQEKGKAKLNVLLSD